MNSRSILVALLGLMLAAIGIWNVGGRAEAGVSTAMSELHRSDQLPYLQGCDSIYWVAYAEDMINSGSITMHVSHLDNAPYGRENIGWAALTMWHVAITGKIWSMVTGLPIHDALLISSRWANPIFYLLALSGMLLIGWRGGRFAAASMAVLVLATAPRVYNDFGFAAPDHHGWHDLTTFGTILCMALGMRNPGRKRWFLLAGIIAAMAIWIGATEQAVTVAGAGGGAFLGLLVTGVAYQRANARGSAGNNTLQPPEYWRIFGVTACLLSLAFYVFEFPGHLFRVRLEVNHPIFSLAFLAGGEFLCRTQRLLFSHGQRARADVVAIALCSFVLGSIALGCVAGPVGWHVMHQAFIQRYHLEVGECKPLWAVMGNSSVFFIGTPILLLIFGVALVWRGNLSMNNRVALMVTVVPCAAATAASFIQFRWAGLAAASAAAIGAVLYLPQGQKPRAGRGNDTIPAPGPDILENRTLSLLGIALPILLVGIMFARSVGGDISELVKSEVLGRVASADVGEAVRQDAESMHRPPIALFSGQDNRQAWIGYVYRVPAIGSLYWDNATGLYDQLLFLSGYDENEARRIAKERGITHVVTTPDAGTVVAYHFILHGTKQPPEIRKTLAYRLAAPVPDPPAWMQLVPVTSAAMRSQGIRIYRVTP